MSWQKEIDELRRREAMAAAMGGPEGTARQRRQGKLTARERIAALADAGSFREFMALSGVGTYQSGELTGFTPKPFVNGTITIDGRKAFVTAGDFTVRGGSGGARGGLGQELSVTQRAIEWQLPYIRLLDASGGSVRSFEEIGRTYLPDGNAWSIYEVQALSLVPTVSAVLGSVAGLPAIYACLAHFSVMVKDISQIFPGGPPVVKVALGIDITKEELGGDRTQLKQVLLNLALNARDAMSTSGQLRIESSTVEINSESPEARLYRPGRFVRLRVADTGEGMDKATLARIFEPFFSTKKAFGAGLGLSIAHNIIVQSQGFIRAESEVGHGTSFEILLPCVGTFRGIGEVARSQRPQGEDATPTVLLVEDEDAVRRLMHRFLEREGYQLLEARNAAEAEAIAEVYQEPIHVLITDVAMPGMTGPELAARLMPLRPDMKTLFVSGHRPDALDRYGLSDRDLTLLPKPFLAAELLRRVQTLLGQGTRPVQ